MPDRYAHHTGESGTGVVEFPEHVLVMPRSGAELQIQEHPHGIRIHGQLFCFIFNIHLVFVSLCNRDRRDLPDRAPGIPEGVLPGYPC